MCLCQNPAIKQREFPGTKKREEKVHTFSSRFSYGLPIDRQKERVVPIVIMMTVGTTLLFNYCYGYTPLRPVTKLITKTIAAIIKRMCISPPATSIKNPISHTTIMTAKIIQRIRPIFFTCPFNNNYFGYSNNYPDGI